MHPISIWQRFWFRPAPYFDLAVLRIGAVGLQCYLMLSTVFTELGYANGLGNELFAPLPVFKILMAPFGWGERPDAEPMLMIFWLTLAVGIAALFGILTNVTLALFALGNLFLQSFIYSFSDFHHPSAIMIIGLSALALSPCGRVLSVDNWVQQRLRPVGGVPVGILDYAGPNANWPIRFLQLFFPLMYLSAVSSKIATGGLDWANGFTLQYYLIHDDLRKGGLDLALWLSQHHVTISIMQVAVELFQATFFLIVFFPRLRWIYLPFGICFHTANWLLLQADFPQWILFYAVYVPWAKAVKWLATAQVRATSTLAPPAAAGA